MYLVQCNVVPSKQQLKTAILDNKKSSFFSISCAFQGHAKKKMSYHV